MQSQGYWYLATVYRNHPLGLEAAHIDAIDLTGQLMKMGWVVYPAIVASHTPALAAALDETSDSWLEYNNTFLDRADGLIVAMMENWELSVGINYEIERTRQSDKPICYLDPESLEIFGCVPPKFDPEILMQTTCELEVL